MPSTKGLAQPLLNAGCLACYRLLRICPENGHLHASICKATLWKGNRELLTPYQAKSANRLCSYLISHISFFTTLICTAWFPVFTTSSTCSPLGIWCVMKIIVTLPLTIDGQREMSDSHAASLHDGSLAPEPPPPEPAEMAKPQLAPSVWLVSPGRLKKYWPLKASSTCSLRLHSLIRLR